MPYFISNKASGCEGWATVKANGEVLACHNTKQEAVDQMVALSLAEGIDVGGEIDKRATGYPVASIVDIDDTLIHMGEPMQDVIDFVNDLDGRIFIVTARPESQREETVKELKRFGVIYTQLIMKSEDVPTPEYKQDVARKLLKTYDVTLAIDNDEDNREAFEALGIETLDPAELDSEEMPDDVEEDVQDDMQEDSVRAINQEAPEYMREAAKLGLSYLAEGKGGSGLVDKTIREARLMADGKVSDDKWIRIAAWIARHMGDLDSPDADPSSDNYPSAGVVAHLLWGSGSNKSEAQRAMEFAQGVVERIRETENQRMLSINVKLRNTEGNDQVSESKFERRTNVVNFDVRELDTSNGKMKFRGYAAVFNSPSQPLPFTEYISEGAFTRSLKSRNEIKMFKNHNTDHVLGSTRAKTLRLVQDSTGLLAEADLPDTTEGRDLATLIERGDVNSMSFGFSVFPQGDSWNADGSIRTLNQIRLHEVSIVTGFPAYEATTASVRNLDVLASRTAVDVDALAGALAKLEAGETLDGEHADLIYDVVNKLRAEEVQPDAVSAELLSIKQKQLDLMLKAF